MRKLLDRSNLKLVAINLGLALAFVGLTYFYLYPGSEAMFDQSVETMMSDGTDPVPVPYAYDGILQTWRTNPHRLFFGSVSVEHADPQYSANYWMPWNERWLIVFQSNFFPIEQIYTAVVFALLLLNGLCMYLLCRYLGWARTVSYALSIAWAFCAYTRARAKVHGALAGIYHLPLIFLALFLVARGKSKRSLAAAAFALLMAGTVGHYYLVISLFLSPLFVLFVMLQPEFRLAPRRIGTRLVVAVLPLMVFLAFNRLVPVASDAKVTADKLMEIEAPTASEVDTFLRVFYAHPIDYFTGDISLGVDPRGRPVTSDLNPLRELVNEQVIDGLRAGNPHERTNGIRWLVIGLGATAIFVFLRRRKSLDPSLRAASFFFVLFAGFCFWLSLSPDFPFRETGLSYFVYSIMPKIRVACRSGIGVHFSLLMLTGFYLTTMEHAKWKKVWFLPGLLPLLFVVDYWPLQPVPMAQVHARYAHLGRENGACGTGLFFPTINSYTTPLDHFIMAQKLRGSDCTHLNAMKNKDELLFILNRFPPIPQFLAAIGKSPQIDESLERLVKCVPLNWIVFHPATPPDWAGQMCRKLGWAFNSDMTCIAPIRHKPLVNLPSRCL